MDKYYNCIYRLREEQVHMMADARKECKSDFENELDTRYKHYSDQFEPMKKKAEEILD
jgi:hypothetical protein